ncbi:MULTISPECIES: RagB/SusD family nutrient uptake outer membrane protein [Sphingobacterium]|uniref:SusD family n=1 Tax=Sphingobacterium multivorum TaxID=28454 RepID=A0A654D632_SPHMU|nr:MULTISPECIES: RagB/SusD family nutrient uptake outer membrane protein [Sphingobacterium]QQT45066.1 RagB/SusD family nutrient uptake outer membrane protein [Sphingobacterium multivorum]SUJ19627.1 SusD family [Sphingobacterium multivorum]VXD00390.1 SusD family [Sphingobacterium multivorum]HAE66550.1 RagB/SusD family nutrient uptake outer membrane protein [Sphingobacterium sp.]
MKFKKNILYSLCIGSMAVFTFSCSKDWLKPKPLSFYEPDVALADAQGMYSALTACERNMRHEFFGDAAPILTEIIQSEVAVEGTTDKAGPQMDMDIALLPDADLNHNDRTKVGWYWYEGFKGIKYANLIISRIDAGTFKDENEKNAILGAAYFQRAYRYFKLVHQFGDVPFIDKEINEPKYDFYSYDRWSILEKLRKDLEFAYQWVPERVDRGRTSKSACGVLLMKVCMALADFDRAIAIGKEIVAIHPLMKSRFTVNKSRPNTNLMFDLHSVEAKLDGANTEGLMYVVSYPGVDGSDRIRTMRNGVPFWNNGGIKTPDGKTGAGLSLAADETDLSLDLNKNYGRGIGRLRPTWYFTNQIWRPGKEDNDLRGIFNRDSWRKMEDLKYNEPNLKKTGNPWYGKNLVKPVGMSVEDSIRLWFSWPHYKLFVPDPLQTQWEGGETPWYIYRSAEVYLLLAESYYWKNDLGQAAIAINEVRQRAGASQLTADEINIGELLDERARELYYEENRHIELVRIAYTYAKTRKPCEIFGGRVYDLKQISGPGGTNANIKQTGVNFWYDRVVAKSNFYNKGVKHKWAEYKISVHHILWPVPANAINTNIKGVINQNIGYPGAEKNKTPLLVEGK